MHTHEAPERTPRSLRHDRDLLARWRRELADDLAVHPSDVDLLVEEELVEMLRERVEQSAET